MAVQPKIKADSRCIFSDFGGLEDIFVFGSNYVLKSHVQVWMNNALLVVSEGANPNDYRWEDETTVKILIDSPPKSVIEMVRITPPSTPVTPTELIYMIEEKRDELVFNNGRGPTFNAVANPDAPDTALLINSLPSSDPSKPNFYFPIIQMLPDGGLTPDPDGLNPGGFHTAAWRFQHRIPASVQAQSMTAGGWFSLVLEKPDDEASLDSKKTCYGFRFLFKGYQNGFEDHEFEHGAINPVAETGAGATRGSAQAIIAEARHEAAQATRTIGTGDSAITFTAQGTEAGRGEAGNDIRIKIVVTTLEGISIQGKDITISTGASHQEANEVADMVNAHPQASELVIAFAAGSGLVSGTADEFIALQGGMNTDGKLVGAQIVLTPRGKDPGPGYAHANGGIVIPGGAFESYGYTANTNGFHTGFAAIIAKGKADPGEAHIEGWYNGFVAHYKTRSRLLWMPLHCAIEVPGFFVDKGTEENPDIRAHNSMWMGIGTDEPEGTLHVKTAVSSEPETPEIILDNANAHGEANPAVARVVMKSVTGTGPMEMVALTGAITDPQAGSEDARLTLSVAQAGALTARWNFAGGLWSEGVTGGDKGQGSINANTCHVGGVKALAKETGGVRLGFGAATSTTIASGAITLKSSNMMLSRGVDTPPGVLSTISGGGDGEVVMLRADPAATTLTVTNAGNIRLANTVTLTGGQRALMLLRTGSDWIPVAPTA